jgi:nicotinamidase/pyrazinamidase
MTEGKTALIAVDVQRDFYAADGALSVPGGHEVIEPLAARAAGVDVVVVSKDWHPASHVSFGDQGGSWPAHCVQDSPGAEVATPLQEVADLVVHKGAEPGLEAYSAFDGRDTASGRTLAEELRDRGVTKVLVGGLATDYCVRATVLAGLAEGFEVTALIDAMRAVDVNDGDGRRAIAEMASAGARLSNQRPLTGDAA